jgi:hypothetical protein
MRSVCATDVETYARRYLALSELDSVHRCDGDVQCLTRKICVQRNLRGYNNYQSFLLLSYLNQLERSSDVTQKRTVTHSFAFLKYVEREDHWFLAHARTRGQPDDGSVHVILAEVWVESDGRGADDGRRDFRVVLIVREEGKPYVNVIPFDPLAKEWMETVPWQAVYRQPVVPLLSDGVSPYTALLWFHVACVTGTSIGDAALQNRAPAGSYLFELHMIDALLPRDKDTEAVLGILETVHNQWRRDTVNAGMEDYRVLDE